MSLSHPLSAVRPFVAAALFTASLVACAPDPALKDVFAGADAFVVDCSLDAGQRVSHTEVDVSWYKRSSYHMPRRGGAQFGSHSEGIPAAKQPRLLSAFRVLRPLAQHPRRAGSGCEVGVRTGRSTRYLPASSDLTGEQQAAAALVTRLLRSE
ncbi:hypothetical protein [Deinococcus sonorensis]|uniref:Lipoprotein n=2 Tax=Deinococcus sonorensis TaxID=309891 RepID=A0AAU7UFW5_9DEIO